MSSSLPYRYRHDGENLVCNLHNSLCGTNQWFAKFSVELLYIGFVSSHAELFHKHQGTSSGFVLLYVDDMVIVNNDTSIIDNLKIYLHARYHIKDPGD